MSANSKKILLRNIKVKKVNEKHYFKLYNKQTIKNNKIWIFESNEYIKLT
jgi:hypothetical protein